MIRKRKNEEDKITNDIIEGLKIIASKIKKKKKNGHYNNKMITIDDWFEQEYKIELKNKK